MGLSNNKKDVVFIADKEGNVNNRFKMVTMHDQEAHYKGME